jgi:hypothetical protein
MSAARKCKRAHNIRERARKHARARKRYKPRPMQAREKSLLYGGTE